jgi:hypothetical protein
MIRVDLSGPYRNEFDLAENGSGVKSTESMATALVEFGVLTIIGFAAAALGADRKPTRATVLIRQNRIRERTFLHI